MPNFSLWFEVVSANLANPTRSWIACILSISDTDDPDSSPKTSSISSRVRPFVSGTKNQMKMPPRKENTYAKQSEL